MHLTRSSSVRRSGLIVFVAAMIAGCTNSSSPPSLGRLLVSVRDDKGAGVPLMQVDLVRTDVNTLWASLRTSSDGTGEFRASDGGLIPAPYVVRLVLSNSYSLAPGETNDKSVTVVVDQTQTVTFVVVKGIAGGTPG